MGDEARLEAHVREVVQRGREGPVPQRAPSGGGERADRVGGGGGEGVSEPAREGESGRPPSHRTAACTPTPPVSESEGEGKREGERAPSETEGVKRRARDCGEGGGQGL